MNAITVKNLAVTLNQDLILNDINTVFPSNKITAILGPNGCGKSTLLKIISGFIHKYQGEVLLEEKSLAKIKAKQLAQKIAILPQNPVVPEDLTVEELVAYGRFPYKNIFQANNKDDAAITAWAMEQTSVHQLKKRQLTSLSGGERQRAWIAMALCQQPDILMLDEPTTYLDVAHQLEVMQIVKKLNKDSGMTVIMVLHDINHARLYADNVIVLHDHEIFAQGQPEEILSVQLLEKVFNVEAIVYKNEQNSEEIIFPRALLR